MQHLAGFRYEGLPTRMRITMHIESELGELAFYLNQARPYVIRTIISCKVLMEVYT